MSRRHEDSAMARPRPALGPNLRRLRDQMGISQRKLAEVSGVARAVIARLEAGTQTSAGLDTIEALAAALGSTSEDLIASAEPLAGVSDVSAVIDEFEAQERGELAGQEPLVYAQPEEIAWLRRVPVMFWRDCPPTMESLAGLVTVYRRRRR